MVEPISLREFGRRVGVGLRSVQYAIETGRLKIHSEKMFGKQRRIFLDWETQEAAWHKDRGDTGKRNRLTVGEKAAGVEVHGDPGQTHETGPDPVAATGAAEKKTTAFQKARSVRETFNAKMAELNFRKAAGALVPAEEVKQVFFEIGKIAQQNMMNIPARVSAILAAETDEKKIGDILMDEIIKALDGIANADLSRLGD